MKDFKGALLKAGLTGNEASVYLALLRYGDLAAHDVAKKIGMDRTLAYTVLNHLIEKGLVSFILKGKKIFIANDPKQLLNTIEEQRIFIEDLIPELHQIKEVKSDPLIVKVYEGKQGLRSIFNEWAQYTSFCSFGATGKTWDQLYEVERMAKQWVKRGGTARIITTPKYKGHKMTKFTSTKGKPHAFQYKYLDLKADTTTTIVEDGIFIYNLAHKPQIIRIKNKSLAKTYQAHFEVLWNQANPC